MERTGREDATWRRALVVNLVSEDGTVHDVLAAIEAIPWVTATQYPPPHQYVILERCPLDAWSVLDTAIARDPDSYLAYFRGY